MNKTVSTIAAVGVVLAAGAAAAPLVDCAGPVTDKTPGWRFEASGGNGGQTFNPLEGWYPDKGGKLVSPRIAIPETGAYYKLSFTASAPERAFECVACYDADGNMLADNYDVVYPGGTNRYARVLYVQEGVKEVEVFFQSAQGCSASDVRLERSSPEEAAAWCDQVYARIRPLKVQPEGDAFLSAPKTLAALRTGKPVRILLLGDSIIQDTFHSQFHALLKRAYPKSDVTWLLSVRGGTGCWFYRTAENFARYVAAYRPDCVILGGISNWQPSKPDYPVSGNGDIYAVGEKILALGAELIVVSPTLSVDTRLKEYSKECTPLAPRAYDAAAEREALALTADKYAKLPSGLTPSGLAELKAECARRGWGFIDAFTPAYRWLYESGRPWSWHNRDYVHSGELGKQVIARILLAHLAPGLRGVSRRPGPGGADILVLSNRHGEAEVALFGAQIRRYDPAGQAPVLFAPANSPAFDKGGTMFGGLPYAWPWFNMNGEAHTEAHGFAFRSVWKVLDTTGSDDVTEVRLLLESTEETKRAWPYDFRIVYTIRLSDRLELDFSTENTGDAAFDVTEGFHPYFNVAECTNTVIRGLDGTVVDKIDPGKPNPMWRGDIVCAPGMSAVHFAPEGAVEIVDGGNNRSIFVWGRENRKVILWNPGPGADIPEFGPGDWRHIVCVEPADIQRECATRILPGRRHELRMTIEAKGKGR